MTYKDIISEFNTHYRQAREAEERFFSNMKGFEEALIFAGLAIDDNGKRLTHANRFQYHALAQSLEALTLSRERIRGQKSFDDLLQSIYEILDHARVRNLNEMYWYDTAFRIGSHLGLTPAHVYLHAGARAGARALGIETVNHDGHYRVSIGVQDLPLELTVQDSTLMPKHYEQILCCFRNRFPAS